MGKLKIPLDFDGVEDFDAIPAGVYPAVIEKLTYKDATEEGKFPQVSVEYTVTDPDYEGRKLWQNLSFSPKAIFRMKRFFDVFGEDYEELEVDEDTGIVLDPDLAGTAVEVKTHIEPYQGVDRNKVDEAPVLVGSGAKKRAAARAKRQEEDDEPAADAPPAKLRRGGRPVR
jgi:hypothetical protein